MKQFLLTKEPDKNDIVRLEGDDYRYLVRVRRLAVGEFFSSLLPDGSQTLIQILSVDGGILTGKCSAPEIPGAALPNAQIPPIILLQALPKGEKMDLIVRQAAEGGIAEIVPFVAEFSLARPKAGKGDRPQGKFSRWERIIKEARQQSGSKTATAIRPPLTMNELFDYWKKINETGALGLLFHHRGLEQNSLHSYLDIVPNIVAFAVGPEGGFSDNEVSRFTENGFKPLTIGDTILRTETAALYCAAAIKILLLEKNSWELKQAKSGSV